MSQAKKSVPASPPDVAQASTGRRPRRSSPAAEKVTATKKSVAPEPVAVPLPETPPAAPARAARKPSRIDAVVSKHQQALAEALSKAQAITYATPEVRSTLSEGKKSARASTPGKPKKPRLVRDSFAMPEAEYATLGALKKRLLDLGRGTKKSELLRAGIAILDALDDSELLVVLAHIAPIKTGRPAK